MADSERPDPPGRIALGRRLIANTLHYSAAKMSATSQLRGMRHDAHLLPAIQRRLQIVLDAFHRDTNVVYDIQGRNDQGCDILIRLSTDTEVQFIGVQVKSHIELLKEQVVNNLIRQHFEATQHYSPMLVFYIVLAADLSQSGPQHRVVRAIEQRFSTANGVIVVDPQHTASFLNLSGPAISALITQTVRTGDPVTSEGHADLWRHPVDCAILLRLIERSLAGEPWMTREALVADEWIAAVAEWTPIADLKGTPFARPSDGAFVDENEFRVSVGLPVLDDSLRKDDKSMNFYWSSLDNDLLDNISPALRRYFLLPDGESLSQSAARLSEFVPDVLDRLENDLVFADSSGDRFAIN